MKPEVDIRIVPLTEDDFSVVAKFLRKFFFPEEPLNSSLERCPEPEDIPFLKVLKDGLSFKAVNVLENSEDNIAGIIVNKEVSLEQKANQRIIDCPKVRKIYKLLNELDERAKIWENVNYEKHFNIVSLSVNHKYRGLGIGYRLVEESVKLAKSLNYNYVSIECSSFFSAKVAVQMGFELLGEIPYKEYLDENMDQVFKINSPHVAIKKLIKRL